MGSALLMILLVSAPTAHARTAFVRGQILAAPDRSTCRPPVKAYWSFQVPNLTAPLCHPGIRGYLVTIDQWDARRAKAMMAKARHGRSGPTIDLYGVRFKPSILMIPKENQSYDITFINRDRFTHEIFSPNASSAGSTVIPPDGTGVLHFSGLAPLDDGTIQTFTLRCRRFAHMQGTVAFVHTTASVLANRGGAFFITRVSLGSHVLRVWYHGRKVHEQTIQVGRRGVTLTVDLRKKKRSTSRKARHAPIVKSRPPAHHRRRRGHRRRRHR
ncbi:MAG: hypothetical protein J7M25_12725 [Deltaproteobacteria bacterium]|nr:hypothetical protein [Deltaproteobacteria bacterium]